MCAAVCFLNFKVLCTAWVRCLCIFFLFDSALGGLDLCARFLVSLIAYFVGMGCGLSVCNSVAQPSMALL